MCVSIYNICVMNIWQGYKSPPTLGVLLLGLGASSAPDHSPALPPRAVSHPGFPHCAWSWLPTHRLMFQSGLGLFSSPGRCLMLRTGASSSCSPRLPCSWLGAGGGMGHGCEVLPCCPGRAAMAPSPKEQPTLSETWQWAYQKNSKNTEWVGIRIE